MAAGDLLYGGQPTVDQYGQPISGGTTPGTPGYTDPYHGGSSTPWTPNAAGTGYQVSGNNPWANFKIANAAPGSWAEKFNNITDPTARWQYAFQNDVQGQSMRQLLIASGAMSKEAATQFSDIMTRSTPGVGDQTNGWKSQLGITGDWAPTQADPNALGNWANGQGGNYAYNDPTMQANYASPSWNSWNQQQVAANQNQAATYAANPTGYIDSTGKFVVPDASKGVWNPSIGAWQGGNGTAGSATTTTPTSTYNPNNRSGINTNVAPTIQIAPANTTPPVTTGGDPSFNRGGTTPLANGTGAGQAPTVDPTAGWQRGSGSVFNNGSMAFNGGNFGIR